ncbi:MAG TPA: lipid IV(A) 3-deoxy-D-manno-octulosonic acid transferase [Noviherbaspirillum sp.]|nr:lipid IV(A) 3-deoxy-D-manno-octulosonic acid transferase [Noviherbaspirillum sp.]
MRLLYSFAWWLALPLVLGRLWWRGRKEPGYRQHMAERFGFYSARPGQKMLWVHAVSVGETRAAEPLVDALLREYPDHAILLTHMTPTGRATGKSLFQKHGDRLMQCYLPYDTGFMVGRFLKHFTPRICILMETEVWPNLIAQCVKHRVPVALVNARLSERSLAKAHRLSALMGEAAKGFSCVAAQTEADAERLRRFGAPNVSVTGSIKFDVTPPAQALATGEALRKMMESKPVLLCASTREGEEDLILDALDGSGLDNALVVIVPRHPQRFDEVAAKIAVRGLPMQRRSVLDAALPDGIRVLLGDSMGEMFAYYTACDLAFIGGSLLPLGGQNLIEACAVGKPVLIGPHTFNFSVVSEEAIAAGAASRVETASDMLRVASNLLANKDECERMGERALAFARQHRGATARTIALLKPLVR